MGISHASTENQAIQRHSYEPVTYVLLELPQQPSTQFLQQPKPSLLALIDTQSLDHQHKPCRQHQRSLGLPTPEPIKEGL